MSTGLSVTRLPSKFVYFRFALPANRNIGKDVKFEKPEAYTTAQKQTLYLMVAMMASLRLVEVSTISSALRVR